jgi:dTDP-4-dehydrorhamnose 3,5-epimerase
MNFVETGIAGVVVVELEPRLDERGFLARSHSTTEFASRDLLANPVECSISYNAQVATLRGLHYQDQPRPDPKLIRCTRGSMYDVAVDLRSESPTYRRWFGVTLSADIRNALHVPAGCAHGFITLESHTEVFYMIGVSYAPGLARGVRWDDPAFAIDWPLEPLLMSERDRSFPDYAQGAD